MIIGVEEWFAGLNSYMTSLKCTSSTGMLTDPKIVEQFVHYFGVDDPTIDII